MSKINFLPSFFRLGRLAAWAVFLLAMVYLPVTALGFFSLKSPQDSIGDPYVSIMELLIILMSLAIVVVMVAVYGYAAQEDKVYSMTALAFSLLFAGITCSVHFIILTVGNQIRELGPTWAPLLLSFQWPSVAYTLDIFAWDVLFTLSMLFLIPVYKGSGLKKAIRILLAVSATLSLLGLLGIPLRNMNVRNIGIIGYGLIAPFAFLLIALLFTNQSKKSEETIASESVVAQ